MKPELSKIHQNRQNPPPMQEVEFALILARMINTVKEDPVQMRIAVYEFARAKLTQEISWADEKERERLLNAFEIAIAGVEDFSLKADQKAGLKLSAPSAQNALSGPGEAHGQFGPPVKVIEPSVAARDRSASRMHPIVDSRTRTLMSTWVRLGIGVLLLGVAAGAAAYKQRDSLLATGSKVSAQVTPPPKNLAKAEQPASSQSQQAKAPAVATSEDSLPLPSVYGVYALNNGSLNELDALDEQVPDKRVAMSTPVSKPSRTVLADGRLKFIVYRRDMSSNAPDRADVRVVARVTRAMTFDAKGRGSFVPVSNAWNIRNIAYEFRVRPVPGNPEMLLLQPENADFQLPAGRYVLVVKNQGLDFTVAGEITEKAQCLERTDAANGTFYSECSN